MLTSSFQLHASVMMVFSDEHTKSYAPVQCLAACEGVTFLKGKMCWNLAYLVLLVSVVS